MFEIVATVVALLLVLVVIQTIRGKLMVTKQFGYNYIIRFSDMDSLPNL